MPMIYKDAARWAETGDETEMKQVWPNYYSRFSCIAQNCKHTCCAGWEIDVDKDTLAYYQTVEGEIGKRLRENIIMDADGNAQFRLTDADRCPFLNEQNLCDLIPTIGEEHLCQICTDHPRFRNFFTDRTEIGLGLCCEAAAILILSTEEKMILCSDEINENLTREEETLILFRQKLFDLMQDRSKEIRERWETVLSAAGAALPELMPAQWSAKLFALERLDKKWESRLSDFNESTDFQMPFLEEPAFQIAMEQLTCYFLYRHLAGALLDGDISGRVSFAVLSAKIIGAIFARACAGGEKSIPELAEIARQYSSEIEYSEENLCTLLDELDELL